jgi:hypothetical protein
MGADRHRVISVIAGLVLCTVITGCSAILGPTTPDDNWRAFESRHFTLLVRPESFAEEQHARLGDVLDDQYDATVATLGLSYAGRITAFLHSSAADAGLESNHSGIAYPDTEALRAVCVPPLDGNLYSLLSHEANHVIQQNGLGRPGTYFMNEGLPSALMSTRYHPYGSEFLWTWTAGRLSSIPALAVLIDDERWGGSDVEYKASASFLAYLIDRGGAEPIRQLYQVRSRDFATRIRELYGRSLDDLDQEWRAFVRARPAR